MFGGWGSAATEFVPERDTNVLRSFKLVRVVRLVRLVKLLRVLRIARVVKRMQVAVAGP